MIVIFIFSHQPHSGSITYHVIEEFFPALRGSFLIDIFNFIIRKSAHFIEYFVLCFLMYSFLKEYSFSGKKLCFFSVIFCFLYALTDEFHQAFVPGRTATIRDCFVDLTGSLFFILIYTLFFHRKNEVYVRSRKIRRKKYISRS